MREGLADVEAVEPVKSIEPVEIDGSRGEGGGQILRTSLALALITGRPLRMRRIRAGRAKPGLRRQHLACVEAAAQLCDAEVRGATLGSQDLELVPRAITGGELAIDIGTAGSTTLVVQTILVPAIAAGHSLTAVIRGGTHNPLAPPFDFIERVYAPHLRAMGADIALTLDRHGFASGGGGRSENGPRSDARDVRSRAAASAADERNARRAQQRSTPMSDDDDRSPRRGPRRGRPGDGERTSNAKAVPAGSEPAPRGTGEPPRPGIDGPHHDAEPQRPRTGEPHRHDAGPQRRGTDEPRHHDARQRRGTDEPRRRDAGQLTLTVGGGGMLRPIELVTAGPITARHATAILAGLPHHVAEREHAVVQQRLGFAAADCELRVVAEAGPANVLLLEVERAEGRELVSAFGEKGLRAEAVAGRACDDLASFLATGVPVGEHLADQLLLPLAVAGGGRFRAAPLSLHATTNIETIQQFLDVAIRVEPDGSGAVIVTVG